MSADPRGFEYPLEPVLRQATWRLEALRAELGNLQRDIDGEERALAELRERHSDQSRRVAGGTAERLDPAALGWLMGWLVELVRRIRSGERTLRDLIARRAELASRYEEQCRKVEAVESHREDCLAQFLQEASARASNEADRDWLARLQGVAAGPLEGGAAAREPTP